VTTDDAIVRAGWLPCTACREPAYATTAAWVGPELIIASYVPTCPHPDPRVVLVDTTQIEHDPRCVATTRAGTRCRNRRAPGAGVWCVNHDPARAGRPGHTRRTPDHWSGGGRDGR